MERVLGGRFWGGWALAGGEEEDVKDRSLETHSPVGKQVYLKQISQHFTDGHECVIVNFQRQRKMCFC